MDTISVKKLVEMLRLASPAFNRIYILKSDNPLFGKERIEDAIGKIRRAHSHDLMTKREVDPEPLYDKHIFITLEAPVYNDEWYGLCHLADGERPYFNQVNLREMAGSLFFGEGNFIVIIILPAEKFTDVTNRLCASAPDLSDHCLAFSLTTD